MKRDRLVLLMAVVAAWSSYACGVLYTRFDRPPLAALRPVSVLGTDPLPVTPAGADQLASTLRRIEVPPTAGLATLAHLVRLCEAFARDEAASPADTASGPRPAGTPPTAAMRTAKDDLVRRLLPETDAKTGGFAGVEFTKLGCRYRRGARRTDPGEQHPGQVLCALAEAGIPLNRAAIASAQTFRVADLVEECAASFDFADEVEWRAVALALYRPQLRHWKNSRRELVSFDRITDELLRRTRARGSYGNACWGTHALYVLAVFRCVDAQVPMWNDRMWEPKVTAALQDAGDRLAQSQRADGSWDEHWELPALSHAGSAVDDGTRLLITGHHLEWLALVPAAQRPPERVLRGAGEFVLRQADTLRAPGLIEEICACSHGLRAFGLAGTRIVDAR